MVRPAAPDAGRGRFGRIDFQLMLLRRMADYQPGLVEDKIRDLGFARSEARAAHRRWQEIVRSRSFPGGMARYRIVLGRPARTLQRAVGDLSCEITQWELELWPGLWFETIAVRDAPAEVVKLALKATQLIGDGLYGVDLKQVGDKPVVIEVNDNPSIDAGVEDAHLGDELYLRIMQEFLRRMERKRQGLSV